MTLLEMELMWVMGMLHLSLYDLIPDEDDEWEREITAN